MTLFQISSNFPITYFYLWKLKLDSLFILLRMIFTHFLSPTKLIKIRFYKYTPIWEYFVKRRLISFIFWDWFYLRKILASNKSISILWINSLIIIKWTMALYWMVITFSLTTYFYYSFKLISKLHLWGWQTFLFTLYIWHPYLRLNL